MKQYDKSAFIRARVTDQMYDQLMTLADGRGEHLTVLVREALTEYLARKINPLEKPTSEGTQMLQEVFSKNPQAAQALVALAESLSKKPLSKQRAA